MESISYFLIRKNSDNGWSITQSGQKIGTAANVVEAIDLANQLAERDYALHRRATRVAFVESEFTASMKSTR